MLECDLCSMVKKLITHLTGKDMTEFEHKYDIIYFGICLEYNCKDNYLLETGRIISERIVGDNGRNSNSYIIIFHFIIYFIYLLLFIIITIIIIIIFLIIPC